MSLNRLLTAAAFAALIGAPALAVAQTAAPAAPAAPAAAAAAASTAAYKPITPNGDIIQTLKSSGEFTTLLKGLDATNLTAVLKNNQGLTLFAPTDAAFAALPPGEMSSLMANPTQLQKLLTHQIINARVDSSKIKGAKGPVPSVAQNPIELDGTGEPLKADNADIIQPDVMATNGVIQVVDQVLMPEAATTASAAASGAGASAAAPATAATTTGAK